MGGGLGMKLVGAGLSSRFMSGRIIRIWVGLQRWPKWYFSSQLKHKPCCFRLFISPWESCLMGMEGLDVCRLGGC